ncbi:MAG: hypothetical protein ABEJ44_07100 [Halanaeroarchaeum sp.]
MAGQPGDDPPEFSSGKEQPPSHSDDASSETVGVDGAAAAWIRERADALGIAPEEYLERVVASLRAVEAGDPREELTTSAEFATLEERVDGLDEEIETKVEDVRERVVQVKREVDEKAPADHDHDDLRKGVQSGIERFEEAESRIEALGDRLDEMASRLDRGFDNYEEILEYLVNRTDDLSADANALLDAMSGLRRHVRRLHARDQRERRTEELKDEANRKGVTEAKCESCANTVSVALLTEPSCPVCGTAVAGVTPKQGFFGSATLDSGSPPALESGEPAEDADDLMDLQSPRPDEGGDGRDSSRDPTAVLDEDGSLVDVDPTAVNEPDESRERTDE